MEGHKGKEKRANCEEARGDGDEGKRRNGLKRKGKGNPNARKGVRCYECERVFA